MNYDGNAFGTGFGTGLGSQRRINLNAITIARMSLARRQISSFRNGAMMSTPVSSTAGKVPSWECSAERLPCVLLSNPKVGQRSIFVFSVQAYSYSSKRFLSLVASGPSMLY